MPRWKPSEARQEGFLFLFFLRISYTFRLLHHSPLTFFASYTLRMRGSVKTIDECITRVCADNAEPQWEIYNDNRQNKFSTQRRTQVEGKHYPTDSASRLKASMSGNSPRLSGRAVYVLYNRGLCPLRSPTITGPVMVGLAERARPTIRPWTVWVVQRSWFACNPMNIYFQDIEFGLCTSSIYEIMHLYSIKFLTWLLFDYDVSIILDFSLG